MAIYMWRELAPITTAWIYHSPEQWLISLSSDWTNWITIADKNLWATVVYNQGDTKSEANCGKYYQWWNNYGFYSWMSFNWNQVDASNYWPWNYYNDSTYRRVNNWENSGNLNLWWDTTDTVSARQGPCDSWFHVPGRTEMNNFKDIAETLRNWWNYLDFYCWLLHIPLAWYKDIYWTTQTSGSYWWYWSSTRWWMFSFYISGANVSSSVEISYWLPIRPFANTPVQPDETRTVLYPTS